MFALTFSTVYKQPDEYLPPETAALAGNTEYPNLNTTDYASRPINRQLRQHKAWECVSTNLKNDNVVVATNKINGREWNSTIWGYEQVDDCSEEAAVFKVQCDALTTCMEYATWNTFIVALHSGKLNIWSTFAQVRNPQNPYCLFLLSSKNEHTHPISSLEVMKANSGKCITGDRNGKLLVWDLNQADIVSCLKYNFAHCGPITAIASDASEESIFYTCSADKSVLLWDIRETRPAKALFDDFDFAFKHLAISTLDSDILLVGDQLGQILTLDKRMPKSFLGLEEVMPRAIKKLVPNGSQLAVLADTNQLKVLDLHDNNKIVYDDQSAKSFLRDAAWYKDNQLLAVGYDSHLHKHQISQ